MGCGEPEGHLEEQEPLQDTDQDPTDIMGEGEEQRWERGLWELLPFLKSAHSSMLSSE